MMGIHVFAFAFLLVIDVAQYSTNLFWGPDAKFWGNIGWVIGGFTSNIMIAHIIYQTIKLQERADL